MGLVDRCRFLTIVLRSGIAFFGTPHNGGNPTLVAVGGVAAKIAHGLGFQHGDNILETLESGSLFTEILREQFRHQLLNYDILSFWGSRDTVSLRCMRCKR